MPTVLSKKIQRRFNRAAETYDEFAIVQRNICIELVKRLKLLESEFNVIADIGCGTGLSTSILDKELNSRSIFAVDFASSLLKKAREKNYRTDVQFVLGDFETTLLKKESMDLIFSNMSLQWSSELTLVLQELKKTLTPNGIFAFSIPTEKNFPELKRRSKYWLPTIDSVNTVLSKLRFATSDAWEASYQLQFQSKQEVINAIRSIGADISESTMCTGLSKNNQDVFLDSSCNTLTYKTASFIFKKKD